MERLSIFDIFKIGVGPSSSHTLGPWKAALRFLNHLPEEPVQELRIHLFGSLSKTGIGHGTDIAVLLGLCGHQPETMDTSMIMNYVQDIRDQKILPLPGQKLTFDPRTQLIFEATALPYHPNALRFCASFESSPPLEETYYSLGGGFISQGKEKESPVQLEDLPFPIESGDDLLAYTAQQNCSVSDIVYQNERYWRAEFGIRADVLRIFNTMVECVHRGISRQGKLPGGLDVKKRAYDLHQRLMPGEIPESPEEWLESVRALQLKDFTRVNKWVSCFALAVNEENASFGRVVTSPTNGAAGVIPAVLLYYYCFADCPGEEEVIRFLLTAGEVGCIFKKRATISAAVGGCQAEIGVSSAMAAAALTEVQGGSPEHALMAAEIAMEHHLGLTCDPIGGLVQVPCIERNTMGAMKAITASNLAMESDPREAKVKFDVIVKTMWDTAQDMHVKYKETAEGGLAFNLPVVLPNC